MSIPFVFLFEDDVGGNTHNAYFLPTVELKTMLWLMVEITLISQ